MQDTKKKSSPVELKKKNLNPVALFPPSLITYDLCCAAHSPRSWTRLTNRRGTRRGLASRAHPTLSSLVTVFGIQQAEFGFAIIFYRILEREITKGVQMLLPSTKRSSFETSIFPLNLRIQDFILYEIRELKYTDLNFPSIMPYWFDREKNPRHFAINLKSLHKE